MRAAPLPLYSSGGPVTPDLFPDAPLHAPSALARECLVPGALLLRGWALAEAADLWLPLQQVLSLAPWRHMLTPGGRRMSVATTSCGALGWVSERSGYRYAALDPTQGTPWPAMPAVFAALAQRAAAEAGYRHFVPDACLINRYAPGASLALHQDRDERDVTQPIVSVSLGLPALFLFGGLQRSGAPRQVPLAHGDVVVWGGPARLCFHGVRPLQDGEHGLTGRCRINLTFRRAG